MGQTAKNSLKVPYSWIKKRTKMFCKNREKLKWNIKSIYLLFNFRSDSSSCRGTSDGSLDSQTSSHDVCADDDSSSSLLPTLTSAMTSSTTAKIDSTHNSSVGSFTQDLVSETSTMSDGENSVATAVEGRIDEDYVSDDDADADHHKDWKKMKKSDEIGREKETGGVLPRLEKSPVQNLLFLYHCIFSIILYKIRF